MACAAPTSKASSPSTATRRLSRELHRLRVLGLIKRVARSYRYYLTRLGRAAIAAACSLTQFQIVPALASCTLSNSSPKSSTLK